MSQHALILDDDESNRLLLLHVLKKRDLTPHEATSGAEALALLDNTNFALAFVDIELPDMSGIDVVKTMRERSPRTLIFMTTANNSPNMMRRACQTGASVYILKPFALGKIKTFLAEMDSDALLERNTLLVMEDRTGTREIACQ